MRRCFRGLYHSIKIAARQIIMRKYAVLLLGSATADTTNDTSRMKNSAIIT